MSEVTVVPGDWPVVRPEGEIDFANVQAFDEALDAAARESPKGFIIDLGSVSYFDSAGVRAILKAYISIHDAGGTLALVVNTRNVRMLLEVLHMERAPGMAILPSVAEACRQLANTEVGA